MIELAHPWALLSLLSLPLILVLHSLRPTRRTVVVSSTALWREALRERRRGLGLEKLLKDLSLLLLLALALALSLGLAGPSLVTRTADSADAVLVLDVSASMQARDAGGERFERARAAAAALVAALPDGARMLVMTSGRAPGLRSGFEERREVLDEAIRGVEPTDEAGRPREALALALSLLRDRERGRVYFVTDGAFDATIAGMGPAIEVKQIGAPAPNIAITRFDVRPELGAEDRFEVLLSLRNYGPAPATVPVGISLDGRTLYERDVELGADGKRTLVLPFEGRARGEARAWIEPRDALAADDRAFAVMGADEALSVLVVGERNHFLESALAALPNVTTTRLDTIAADALAREARAHDVVLLDRIAAPALARGNYLLLDTVPPGLPFRASGTVARPAIRGKGPSALVRDIDLTGIKIDSATRVSIDEDAAGVQRLFWTDAADLALTLLHDEVRAVYLAFDVSRSTFPLHAAFPLFLEESLSWLRPRTSRFARTQLAAGESHVLTVPEHTPELIVRMPSGDGVIHAVSGGSLAFDDTARAGIYRYTADGVRKYFAVNLTDERESDIRPRAATAGERPATLTGGVEGTVTVALWPYLCLLALGLLAAEWAARCAAHGRA